MTSRRSRTAILVAVVAVAVALVAWLVYRHSKGGESGGTKVAEAQTGATPHRVRAPGPTRRGPGPQELNLQIDDDPAGSLRLEGQVVEGADQAPVGGAIVSIDSNPPRMARTEQDGSFFFDKLLSREYTVVARAKAGVAGPVSVRLDQKTEPVILRLRAGARVEVTVAAARDHKPLAGGQVELRGLDTRRAQSGADGVAAIDGVVPGGYAVVADAPGFAREQTWLRVAGGGDATKVRLELRPGAAVAGHVVDPGGAPVGGALVVFHGASAWGRQADPRRDGVTTKADGSFRFDALPAGTVRFEATHRGFASGRSELVSLDGVHDKSGVVVRLEAGATVTGVVVTQSGQPVAGARVRAAVKSRSMLVRQARQAYADDQGRFVLADVPRVALDLVAQADAGASSSTPVDVSKPPYKADVTLTLDLDGAISGTVVDRADQPVEGAQVVAWPDLTKGMDALGAFRLRGLPQELTDAGGRFTISGLAKGAYEVRAMPPGAAGDFADAMLREPVRAKAGDSGVKVVLPRDGGIKGKVAFADGSAPEMFTVSLGFAAGAPFSGEKGAFVLNDVAPRSYTVTVQGPGFDTRKVHDVVVSEGQVADLGTVTVTKGRTISGRVVTADGQPAAGATVRAGRMLFGDGSSSKAAFGGSPMARNQKATEADEDGQFRLYGVGNGTLAIVAEHPDLGRSPSMMLPGSTQSVTGLSLVLAPFGSLEGTVTKDGAPVGQMIVTASSLTAASAVFSVASGDDGAFRFDHLAPDSYKVSAMVGAMPMAGFTFHSKTATVESGKTAHVDLVVESGQVSLAVTLAEKSGKPLGFSEVIGVLGQLQASTARELQTRVGAMGNSTSRQAFSIRGQPVTMAGVEVGHWTLCALSFPSEVKGMADTMDYAEREGDNLPVYCRGVDVAAQPASQSVTLPVVVPPYVPPPT